MSLKPNKTDVKRVAERLIHYDENEPDATFEEIAADVVDVAWAQYEKAGKFTVAGQQVGGEGRKLALGLYRTEKQATDAAHSLFYSRSTDEQYRTWTLPVHHSTPNEFHKGVKSERVQHEVETGAESLIRRIAEDLEAKAEDPPDMDHSEQETPGWYTRREAAALLRDEQCRHVPPSTTWCAQHDKPWRSRTQDKCMGWTEVHDLAEQLSEAVDALWAALEDAGVSPSGIWDSLREKAVQRHQEEAEAIREERLMNMIRGHLDTLERLGYLVGEVKYRGDEEDEKWETLERL